MAQTVRGKRDSKAEALNPSGCRIRLVSEWQSESPGGLAHVINILDPDTIVPGGGLSNIERLYRNVPDLIQRYVFSDGVETSIVRAAHALSHRVNAGAIPDRDSRSISFRIAFFPAGGAYWLVISIGDISAGIPWNQSH
jgi:predicted NBD/HSP70 family sugar kinase